MRRGTQVTAVATLAAGVLLAACSGSTSAGGTLAPSRAAGVSASPVPSSTPDPVLGPLAVPSVPEATTVDVDVPPAVSVDPAVFDALREAVPEAEQQTYAAQEAMAEALAELTRQASAAASGEGGSVVPSTQEVSRSRGGGRAGSSSVAALHRPVSEDGGPFAGMAVLTGVIGVELALDSKGRHSGNPFTTSDSKEGSHQSATMDFTSDEAGNVEMLIEAEVGADGKANVEGKEVDASVSAKFSMKIKGNPCPDADGIVTFDYDLSVGGDVRAGSKGGARSTRHVGKGTGTVNDNADLVSFSYEATQELTGMDQGKPYYVEFRSGYRVDNVDQPGAETLVTELQAPTVIRKSQNASRSAVQKPADQAQADTAAFVARYLRSLEAMWKGGRCVVIVADSPGQVDPSSSHDVKVSVKHKLEGTSLSVPVDITLTGGESVNPTKIERAPGSFTYRAPEKSPGKATISLVSKSRRGIGKKDLGITIGLPAYVAKGGGGDFKGTGTICSLAKPFTIQGGGVTVSFTPKDATAGTYSYKGSLKGFPVFGKGTYSVDADENGGTLTATGPGTVKTPIGNMTATDSERYTLTPTDPCE